MSLKALLVECISVLAGGVIGTVVTALAAWLFAHADLVSMLASPGRYVLGIVTVAVFAVFYDLIPKTPATLASLGVGIVLPTLVGRFAFDASLPWPTLFALGLVFALVALSTYRFVHAGGGAAAGTTTDRF